MDLRQFRRPADESYDNGKPGIQYACPSMIEKWKDAQRQLFGSSIGARKSNPKIKNAKKEPAVPLRRSQRLIAKRNAAGHSAPKEEALNLTVHKQQVEEPATRCRVKKKHESVGGADVGVLKNSSAELQNILSDAKTDAKSAAPPNNKSSTEKDGVCSRQNKNTTDAAEDIDQIDFDGIIQDIFQSTAAQTKQIDVYKMEHNISTNESEPDDDLFIEIGPKGTLVPFNAFKKISWSESLQAAHELLSLVFPLRVLETHVLSQRYAPLELTAQCKGKPLLDDDKIFDICFCITDHTDMSDDAFIFITAKRLAQLAKNRVKPTDTSYIM